LDKILKKGFKEENQYFQKKKFLPPVYLKEDKKEVENEENWLINSSLVINCNDMPPSPDSIVNSIMLTLFKNYNYNEKSEYGDRFVSFSDITIKYINLYLNSWNLISKKIKIHIFLGDILKLTDFLEENKVNLKLEEKIKFDRILDTNSIDYLGSLNFYNIFFNYLKNHDKNCLQLHHMVGSKKFVNSYDYLRKYLFCENFNLEKIFNINFCGENKFFGSYRISKNNFITEKVENFKNIEKKKDFHKYLIHLLNNITLNEKIISSEYVFSYSILTFLNLIEILSQFYPLLYFVELFLIIFNNIIPEDLIINNKKINIKISQIEIQTLLYLYFNNLSKKIPFNFEKKYVILKIKFEFDKKVLDYGLENGLKFMALDVDLFKNFIKNSYETIKNDKNDKIHLFSNFKMDFTNCTIEFIVPESFLKKENLIFFLVRTDLCYPVSNIIVGLEEFKVTHLN
jgi:hypothetical protein